MFNVKKDMTPLNYALQYEMSKKLSKLLYTVDDDIMNVEPLVGDSNYNSVATVNRNGKITRVKYNRKKLDDTLNEICLAKQTDTDGNSAFVCLTPVVGEDGIGGIPEYWDAEQTNAHLDMYGITWNRTMGNIMDTDNKVFNMVGNRKPVGIFDIVKDIKLLEDGTYVANSENYNTLYGITSINYGERLNFKIPFNSQYGHGLSVSNGSISKKISANTTDSFDDDRCLNINAGGYQDNYASQSWYECGLSNFSYPDISRDSTVQYSISYDSDGVTVNITDDQHTISIEKFEMLTDKVFIRLALYYLDPVPSPASRVDIPFNAYKEVIENIPALNTLSFSLPWRVARGNRVRNSDGNMVITPVTYYGSGEQCILNYACRAGINRLKFISEIENAFNSQYVNEIVIGLSNNGYENDNMLPYFKFNKRNDDNWDMTSYNNPFTPVIVSSNDLKNFDIMYDSVKNDFILYAQTDPNDTSALDTLPNDTSSNILSFFRNFQNYNSSVLTCDIVVKLNYTGGFDQIPVIRTTRYTPAPAVKKFNFINAIYTTIGDKCTTHYGSTTYPVEFSRRVALEVTDNFKLGYHRINALANIIGSNDVFVMDVSDYGDNLPNNRRLVITTERLTVADLMAGKYQGIEVKYSDVEFVESGDTGIIKYNKRVMTNTLPSVFTLKEYTNNDSNSQSDIDRIPHMLQLLGNDSNQYVLHQLLVDIAATEYFIYDIRQDYAYNPADQQT